jgi:membrane protein DedA with SNARE-associated domain
VQAPALDAHGLVFRKLLPHNTTMPAAAAPLLFIYRKHYLSGQTATTLIQHFGYIGLSFGLIISTMGVFSSELLLLLAGVAVRQGRLSIFLVLPLVIVAQLIGGSLSHAIGRYGGVPLITRYGRYVLLSKNDLERAHRWFTRYGRIATALGYCLPVVRGYIGYAAGIAGESRRLFLVGALVGTAIWSVFLIILGYLLAGHITGIEQLIRPFSFALIAALLLAVAWFIWHRLQDRTA